MILFNLRWNLVVGLTLCLAAPALAQAPDLKKLDIVERSTPNGPVAFVDGVAISRAEYIDTYQKHVAEVALLTHDNKPSDEFRVRAGLTTLGELVRRQILVVEAEKRGVKVSDAEVEKAYAEKLKRFQTEMKKPDGSAPTEEDVLKTAGQTRQDALESLRRQLLEQKMSEQIAKEKGVKVTDKEVSDFYSKKPELFKRSGQIHLNQILIVPKGGPKSDEPTWKAAEDTAKRARARILAGEKFDAVARDMSQSPDAAKGGEMGMMPAEQLPPFFVSVAKAMKPGDVSEPFRSPYGVHVIRLVETADSKDVTFDEAKPKIHSMLEQMRREEAVDKFIEPVVNDPKRTQIFLQLERTLAALGFDPKAPKKPEAPRDAAVSAQTTDAAAAATETPSAPAKKAAAASDSTATKPQTTTKPQKKSTTTGKSSTKKKGT